MQSWILLCKYPEPGLSKTRLTKDGIDGAEFARASIKDLIQILLKKKKHVTIMCFPKTRVEEFKKEFEVEDNVITSTEKDLGLALADAFAQVFDKNKFQGYTFLGMDCVDPELFEDREDNVIYPANDGGYVRLTIQTQELLPLFENIKWSAPTTCVDQLRQLQRLNIPTAIGKEFVDVDTKKDLLQATICTPHLKKFLKL